MGGWDPITPLKPYLGEGFSQLVARLQAAIDTRYALPAWTPESHARHKQADRLAAASEAYHVAGWSRAAMREHLGIALEPVERDPVATPDGMKEWQPLAPRLAEARYLAELRRLLGCRDAAREGPP